MHRRRLIMLATLLTACGGDDAPPLGPTTFDVSGNWYWEEAVSDNNVGVFCFDSGGIAVTQNGPRFSATGVQTGFCNSENFSDPFDITDGTIDQTAVAFRIAPCPYRGTLHGTQPDSLTGTIICTLRVGGQTLHIEGTWRFLRDRPDLVPPQVAGDRTGSITPNFFLLGDTLSITVNATDERDLRFVGYRLGGPAPRSDSIAVSGTIASHTFAVPITAAMEGTSQLAVFARDRSNAVSVDLTAVQAAAVRGRRTRTVVIPGAMRDFAYDAKRARLYVTISDSAKVFVVNPASAALESAIALPGTGAGLDLSPGGDSLFAALYDRGSFAVLNLASSGLDTVHIDFDTTTLHHPSALRIAADGQVFVVGSDRGISGLAAQLVSYDLATGNQQRRTDVGAPPFAGMISTGTLLARSGDRTRLLLLQGGVCCPQQGQMYDAATHTFGPSKGTVDYFTQSVSATTTGDLFLIGLHRFTADLSPGGSYTEPDWGFRPTVISADGSKAYIGITSVQWTPGFVIRRTSDNVLLEQSYVPSLGQLYDKYALLPDGITLIAFEVGGLNTTTTLYFIDLR